MGEIKKGVNLKMMHAKYDEYLEKRWEKYEIWTIVYGIYAGHPFPEIFQAATQ